MAGFLEIYWRDLSISLEALTAMLFRVKSNKKVTEANDLLSMRVFSGGGWQDMPCHPAPLCHAAP